MYVGTALVMVKTHGKRPVVLSTDCGTEMDDQWAIAHMALSPEIDLQTVAATHAPNLKAPATAQSAAAAEEVLTKVGAAGRVSVVRGADGPLAGYAPVWSAAVEAILEKAKCRSRKNRLTVAAIGAATDVGSALLLDPSLSERIEVVAMAFLNRSGGQEWNVKNDVHAWDVILRSGCPVTIGAQDVCIRRLVLSKDEARQRLAGTPAGDYLAELMRRLVDSNPDGVRQTSGRPFSWPVWDEVTTAVMKGLARLEDGPRCGLDTDCTLRPVDSPSSPPVRWVADVDAEALWTDLARLLRERVEMH